MLLGALTVSPNDDHIRQAMHYSELMNFMTGTQLLIESGSCPECFQSTYLWWFSEAPINGVMKEGVIYCTAPGFIEDGIATAWQGDYIAPANVCPHGTDRTDDPCESCDSIPAYVCHVCGMNGGPDNQLATDDGDGCLFICNSCASKRGEM